MHHNQEFAAASNRVWRRDPMVRIGIAMAAKGLGLLLLKVTNDPVQATPAQIEAAAWSTVPNAPVLFWCFRFMVAIGLFLTLFFATAFYLSARHRRFPQSGRRCAAAQCLGLGAMRERRRACPAVWGSRGQFVPSESTVSRSCCCREPATRR
jgi:cytochrome bd-type quinol oxidase subunit 1